MSVTMSRGSAAVTRTIAHRTSRAGDVTYGVAHVRSGAVRAATTLALWAAAWQGGASPDDVLAAIDGADHRAGVRAATAEIALMTGLPGPGGPSGRVDGAAVRAAGGW